jgi:hypothetical protein
MHAHSHLSQASWKSVRITYRTIVLSTIRGILSCSKSRSLRAAAQPTVVLFERWRKDLYGFRTCFRLLLSAIRNALAK